MEACGFESRLDLIIFTVRWPAAEKVVRPYLFQPLTKKGFKMSQEKISLSAGVQPGETSYVPPAAAVPLPSQGKFYPQGHPFHGKDLVEIKAMTATEEDILTSRGLLKTGKVLDALIRSCLIDKSVDIGSLLVGDKNAILVAIRITGYGQLYTASVECPVCGETSQHTFDLAKLPIRQLTEQPVEPGVNEFSCDLPVMRARVKFKLLTGNDEKELASTLEKMRKLGGAENLVTTRIMHQVTSIGGETDRQKLANIIRHMPAADSRVLRKKMDEVAPTVDLRQQFTCQSCNEESEVDVPMGAEFFWPST